MSRRSRNRFSCLLAIILLVTVSAAAQRMPAANPEKWTGKDLKEALASAKTPQDHARIAQYYRGQALQLQREAKKYAALVHQYGGRTGRHCNCVAKELVEQAREDLRLAKAQDALAKPSASLLRFHARVAASRS